MKKIVNNTANWLWQNKKTVIGVVTVGLMAAGAFNWQFQDAAISASGKIDEVVIKINEEGGKRTNEFGDLIIWKEAK